MERPTSRSMMGHHHHHHQRHQHRNYHADIVPPPTSSLGLHLRNTTMINGTSITTTTAYNDDAKPVVTKMSEHRRNNKPIMEKRRRARINSCLGELKGLILQAMKKDPARHSKLEKADILEMTVKHLQNLQRQQMAVAVSTDPTVITKFRAGFNECATEVASYVGRIDGVDTGVRQRLVGHLRSCITGLNHLPGPPSSGAATFGPPLTAANATFQSASDALNILSRAPLSTVRDDANSNGTALRMFAGLHLVPSRLPNGDIAFLLPQQSEQQQQHQQDHDRSSATPPSSSRSDLSDDDDDDDDQDYERERSDSAPLLKSGVLPFTKTVPRLLPAPFPLATTATPASTAQRDRRTPSAFTSVLTGSAVQSVVTSSTTPPIATGNGSGSGGSGGGGSNARTCTVTSSTGNTFSSLEDSSAGPSQAEQSTKSDAIVVEVENEATPSTSSVCSTTDNDKMWRPW